MGFDMTLRIGTMALSVLLLLILPPALLLSQASSAAAAGKAKRPQVRPRTTTLADASSHCRGANLFHCGPVYNGNDYLGSDPDPFIRLMIQRDLGSKYGGDM
jgi:hypothetical protein